MQAPRTSTKAVEAMENLIDRAHLAFADQHITQDEWDELMDDLVAAAYLVGKTDAQIDVGMVAFKSGPDSDRFRQVERSYLRTYARNVSSFQDAQKRRRGANHDDAA